MMRKSLFTYRTFNKIADRHAEGGQSLVEFALVLPLLLAMIFGIIDAGWMGYQAAAFNYSYATASWDIASSSIVNYDYGSVATSSVPDSVAEAGIKESLRKSALPGFDPDDSLVTIQTVSLANAKSDYTIPDMHGNEASASRVERSLDVRATVVYYTKPLVGYSLFSTRIEKELEFNRLVGVEHRE